MKANMLAARKAKFEKSNAQSDIPRLQFCQLKLKKILVAVDFSEASRNAVQFAAGLAKLVGGEIVLLHILERVPGELKILEAAFVDTSFRHEAKKNLLEWQTELISAGIKAQAVFREEAAIDRQITEVAKEAKADLIVLGRHGRALFLLKNTVNRVLGKAPCPVLVGA